MSDLQNFRFAVASDVTLESERIDVVEWLMEAELEAGDHRLVVGELAGLAKSHPTRGPGSSAPSGHRIYFPIWSWAPFRL